MSNKQETIADIVAEMRNESHAGDESCLEWVGAKMRTYADRIEAAAKREREAGAEAAQVCGEIGEMIGREATREKSSRVGNAEKMREALNETQSVIAKCMDILNRIPSGVPYDGLIDDVADELGDLRDSHVKPALATTPRNCDVGTDEEQSRRYEELCDRHTCGSRCSLTGCPMYEHDCSPLAWGQMPYTEGGTTDGKKH